MLNVPCTSQPLHIVVNVQIHVPAVISRKQEAHGLHRSPEQKQLISFMYQAMYMQQIRSSLERFLNWSSDIYVYIVCQMTITPYVSTPIYPPIMAPTYPLQSCFEKTQTKTSIGCFHLSYRFSGQNIFEKIFLFIHIYS